MDSTKYSKAPSMVEKGTKRNTNRLMTSLLFLVLVCSIVSVILIAIALSRCNPARHLYASKTIDKPHVLFILLDDFGYNDIGYNNPDMKTPNIDAMAKNGRILQQHYVLSLCSPSRHALLTGRYPFKNRMGFLAFTTSTPDCSPTDIPFLQEKLQKEGYKTHLIGKWHLGYCHEACTPTHRGFDTFFGMYGGMEDHFAHHGVPPEDNLYDWHENNQVCFKSNGTHTTDLVTDRAIQLLDEHKNTQPLFMLVSYPAPHFPVQAPQKYIDMFPNIDNERRLLYAMIAHLDFRIQDLIDRLKRNGLYDNTLVIFTGDNGGDISARHDNSPLRGAKGSLWEGGSRVPAVVAGPLVENPGQTHDGLMHVTDWYPTILKLAGVPLDGKFDGIDQSDMILKGRGSKRTEFVYNINTIKMLNNGQAAIRVGDYKLIWGYEGWTDGWGLTARFAWKYQPNLEELGIFSEKSNDDQFLADLSPRDFAILNNLTISRWANFEDIRSGAVHLFNIRDDPEERHDLASSPRHQQRVLDMKHRVLELLPQLVEPKPHMRWMAGRKKMMESADRGALTVGWCHDANLSLAADISDFN